RRGRRIAFGDGRKIIWDQHSVAVFRNNPNVARPGSEGSGDLEWIEFYKGHRLYNCRVGDRWVWSEVFRAVPGELFFSTMELSFAARIGCGFVLIEPNVPKGKAAAPNKTWPLRCYQQVADGLRARGADVRQFAYPGADLLDGVRPIRAPNFRHALAAMMSAELYVGPEGGLHHGAAAV